MKTSRRDFAQKSSMGLLSAGFLARVDKVAAAQSSGSSIFDLLQQQATGKSEALLLKPSPGAEGPPAPTTDDRLTLEWNKRTVARFKEKLAQNGIQAFLVRNPLNTTYLTGYWHTTTERPEATFMNHNDPDPWFMYPALDRDLVRSWWFGSGKSYFDFKDAEGSFPNEGRVVQGKTVDPFRFLLEGVREHGIQGKKIGIDGELYPSESAKAREILPDVEWVNIDQTLMDMRMVKTSEELALWRRAYVYFDRAHAFARDYILTHGTDITDYEVAMATELWINQQLYSDLKLDNGTPHHGVKTNVEIGVRAGPVTAYPHPNQPYFNRIGRGMALQVSGGASIGGYGGENYRMYIIADKAGEFDPHMRKLWEVSQHCCDLQVDLQVDGATCSSVAYRIHKYQVENGVQKYIYHRPAHGSGVEGHQPPYLALGDYTVLKKSMCFSEEPGLFDPENGCGFNWSDTVVTGTKSGYRMSRVPYSKEWCWIGI